MGGFINTDVAGWNQHQLATQYDEPATILLLDHADEYRQPTTQQVYKRN
jgi:hypothetical protein